MSDHVKRADDLPAVVVTAGSGTTKQVLIGDDTAPHFLMRRFVMQPGGGMPRHTNTVEHEQYVLAGTARVRIGDEVHEVSAGNVLYMPAGVPHWYRAGEGETFEFLCIVPNLPDRIQLAPDQSA